MRWLQVLGRLQEAPLCILQSKHLGPEPPCPGVKDCSTPDPLHSMVMRLFMAAGGERPAPSEFCLWPCYSLLLSACKSKTVPQQWWPEGHRS